MFKFEFKDCPTEKTFSDLRDGDIFCHALPATFVLMKKLHVYNGNEYQSIDLQNGQSMVTSGGSVCIPVNIKAFVTKK